MMAMPTQATELFLLEDLEDTGKMRGYKRLVLETPPQTATTPSTT